MRYWLIKKLGGYTGSDVSKIYVEARCTGNYEAQEIYEEQIIDLELEAQKWEQKYKKLVGELM